MLNVSVVDPFAAALEGLMREARAAEAEETALRRETALKIAALERVRAYAFRRYNFIRLLAEAARQSPNRPAAVAHQRAVVLDRLGWPDAEAGGRAHVFAALTPIMESVARLSHPDENERKTAEDALDAQIRAFEDWHQTTFESEFWTLFDHYAPETPVVDF